MTDSRGSGEPGPEGVLHLRLNHKWMNLDHTRKRKFIFCSRRPKQTNKPGEDSNRCQK